MPRRLPDETRFWWQARTALSCDQGRGGSDRFASARKLPIVEDHPDNFGSEQGQVQDAGDV